MPHLKVDLNIRIHINGQSCTVAPGLCVAAALALHGSACTSLSVSGQARAPLCGMGICHECRVTIDGQAHQLAFQTICRDHMRIEAL